MQAINFKTRKKMSKSTAYQSRKSELEQKEKLLLSDMSEKGDKVKTIVKWSLLAGVIALLGFGLYRSFTSPPPKKKKKKNKKREFDPIIEEDNQIVDSLITYGSPIIGDWLMRTLKKDSESSDRD